MKMDASLSLNAVCGVIDGYGFGDNAFTAILVTLKERNLIKSGRVLQSELAKVIKEFSL